MSSFETEVTNDMDNDLNHHHHRKYYGYSNGGSYLI